MYLLLALVLLPAWVLETGSSDVYDVLNGASTVEITKLYKSDNIINNPFFTLYGVILFGCMRSLYVLIFAQSFKREH